MPANSYYDSTGAPSTGSTATSSTIRAEFDAIETGFTAVEAALALKATSLLTGYVSAAGTVAATDTILQAIQKLNGNDATNANLTGIVTSTGNATAIADSALSIAKTSGLQTALDAKEATANKDATGGYAGLTLFKLNLKNAANTFTNFFTNATTAARTWTLPDKDGTVAMTSDITGTNSGTNTGDQTNITGNAATVTTNANLTGPVTSVGNATAIADAALSIAKTSGLQTALDAKALLAGSTGQAFSVSTLTAATSVLSTGTGGVGYAAGAGGTVTQATSKSTAVTLNKMCGQITMYGATSLTAFANPTVFTLNNSLIVSTDTVLAVIGNGISGTENYSCSVSGVAAGSCTIGVQNITAGALSDAVVINFSVIKGVSA